MEPSSQNEADSRRNVFMCRLFAAVQMARFNENYYQARLATTHAQIRSSNVAVALSSCVAFLGVFNILPAIGPAIIKIFSSLAAAIAAARPFLGLDAKALQFEKASAGHAATRVRLEHLVNALKLAPEVLPEHLSAESEIYAFRDMLTMSTDPVKAEISQKAWAQTLKEYPPDRAWK